MRDFSPSPMLSRYAVLASNASTSRKSSDSAPGTFSSCQVTPPSVVFRHVPPAPLAHAILSLTALTPRKRAFVPLVCSIHWAAADWPSTLINNSKRQPLGAVHQKFLDGLTVEAVFTAEAQRTPRQRRES